MIKKRFSWDTKVLNLNLKKLTPDCIKTAHYERTTHGCMTISFY